MIENNAYFVSHCDDDLCDLGVLIYRCPMCKSSESDYDAWWEQDTVYSGNAVEIHCSNCQAVLEIKRDEDSDIIVSKK